MEGCVAGFALLSHTGRAQVMDAESNPRRVAADAPTDRTRDVRRRLDTDEIEAMIQAFAVTAQVVCMVAAPTVGPGTS
jgi:2,4-dienoyl-CoA reductase-like NADH-dependent reductase (Old Yellow Enzyme family)